jgi:hypothetical protein
MMIITGFRTSLRRAFLVGRKELLRKTAGQLNAGLGRKVLEGIS